MRYNFTPTTKATIKIMDKNTYGEDVEKFEHLYIASGKVHKHFSSSLKS